MEIELKTLVVTYGTFYFHPCLFLFLRAFVGLFSWAFFNGCWLFGLLCLNFKLTQSFSSISGKHLRVFLGVKIQFPLALFGTLTKGVLQLLAPCLAWNSFLKWNFVSWSSS